MNEQEMKFIKICKSVEIAIMLDPGSKHDSSFFPGSGMYKTAPS